MKTLILPGTIVDDWEEANRYDEQVDKTIAELREALDDLDAALRDDEPSEHDFINTVEHVVEEHADVEDACAEMDDLELDDAPALPSINVQAPTDKPQSRAKKVCISTWLPCTLFFY